VELLSEESRLWNSIYPYARKEPSRRAFSFSGLALHKRGLRQERWDAASSRAREELLRPCPYIGYDHDRIGVHCLSREAYGIAERSFRRAIWLNPYEPGFQLHLAHALFRQKRHEEALGALDELREQWPDFARERKLREVILQTWNAKR
jgi:tetratricopeptide (TPR) repeat protein